VCDKQQGGGGEKRASRMLLQERESVKLYLKCFKRELNATVWNSVT
jgi:hypothetical protein